MLKLMHQCGGCHASFLNQKTLHYIVSLIKRASRPVYLLNSKLPVVKKMGCNSEREFAVTVIGNKWGLMSKL